MEEAELSLSAVEIPDPFVKDRADTVSLLVGNSKNVPITGIEIKPSGDGMVFQQTSFFIGKVGAHNTSTVDFTVTPEKEGTISFNVTYWSGINSHQTKLSIPVVFGLDKLAADPVITNVKITNDGGTSTLSGDISNVGLEDANALVVALNTPNAQNNPNSKYVVGKLEADDFSSFEISLMSDTGREIPLIMTYKDINGNPYEKEITVDQSIMSQATGVGSPGMSGDRSGMPSGGGPGGMGMLGGFGSGMDRLPVQEIAIALVLVVVVILGYRYIQKKKGKIHLKQKAKPDSDEEK